MTQPTCHVNHPQSNHRVLNRDNIEHSSSQYTKSLHFVLISPSTFILIRVKAKDYYIHIALKSVSHHTCIHHGPAQGHPRPEKIGKRFPPKTQEKQKKHNPTTHIWHLFPRTVPIPPKRVARNQVLSFAAISRLIIPDPPSNMSVNERETNPLFLSYNKQ